jgi:HD superfamily phosphohydrolase
MAHETIRRFQQDQPEMAISDLEVQLVTVAGLCHDVGHGPFSHAFEGWINKGLRKGDPNMFDHENRSIELFRSIVDDGYLTYKYTEEDIKMITDMINGVKVDLQTGQTRERGFLYEIVANKRNNIDVDKFDYLARDSYHCGMPVPDYNRLRFRSRILENQICYHSNESFNISEMFRKRFSMFRTVYCHEVGLGIEMMLQDILSAADSTLKIAERARSVRDYIYTIGNLPISSNSHFVNFVNRRA